MSSPPPYGPPPYGPLPGGSQPPQGPPPDWQGAYDPAYGPPPQGPGPYSGGPYGQVPPAGYPPPPGMGWGPPQMPNYGQPQRKSRAWLWILGSVSIVVVAAIVVTAVVLVTRAREKPDITALTADMTATESDFPSLSGGEYSGEPVDDDPEYEAIEVTPSACEYLINYPRADQTVSSRVNSDEATVAVYLQIDDERPDLKAAFDQCEGKTLRSDDNTFEVKALDVDGVPSWALAETLTYDNTGNQGSNNVIGGYHRGVYVEAWSSADASEVSPEELVSLFNAQVDRLDRR